MTTLGAELTWPGTRLSSLCGVPWTHAALIRVGIVAHFTKATAAAITPNSYVIILYVRHLCTMHAMKTFILLISQCICALHLSFLVSSLFFFLAPFHKWQNASQFPNNWLLHRNILKAAAFL